MLVIYIQNLQWVHRSDKAVREFQGFVLDLLSAHTYYTKYALDKLVAAFKPGNGNVCFQFIVNNYSGSGFVTYTIISFPGGVEEWFNGIPSDKDKMCFMKIHDTLSIVLQVIPM